MIDLKQHPINTLVKPPTEDEYMRLRKSIRDGYDPYFPITLYEGMVLDGWQRYRAAGETRQRPTFTVYLGDDPAGFVLRSNYHRSLDRVQLAIMETRLYRSKKQRKRDTFFCLRNGQRLLEQLVSDLRTMPVNPWFQKAMALEYISHLQALFDCCRHETHEACDGRGCEGCRGCGWIPKWAKEKQKES